MSAIPHVRESGVFGRSNVGARAYPRARVVVRRRARSWADVARFGAWVFGMITVLHVIAAFMGQLEIEQTRRAAIHAGVRALRAEMEAAGLRKQIDGAASASTVEGWAALNGFRSPYLVIK